MATMVKKIHRGAVVLILAGMAVACGEEKADRAKGTIKSCSYSMGEEQCGKCYCLELPERGCLIIDKSSIAESELASNLDKEVLWEGTGEGLPCSKMCPCYIKLTFLEPAP